MTKTVTRARFIALVLPFLFFSGIAGACCNNPYVEMEQLMMASLPTINTKIETGLKNFFGDGYITGFEPSQVRNTSVQTHPYPDHVMISGMSLIGSKIFNLRDGRTCIIGFQAAFTLTDFFQTAVLQDIVLQSPTDPSDQDFRNNIRCYSGHDQNLTSADDLIPKLKYFIFVSKVNPY